jgi:hypothetical protein
MAQVRVWPSVCQFTRQVPSLTAASCHPLTRNPRRGCE